MNVFLMLMTGIVTTGGFLFGFYTCIIAGAFIFIRETFPVNLFLESFIVSSVVLGSLVGSLVSGAFSQHYGAQRLLLVTSILFFFATIISICAPNVFVLIFGRVLTGLAIGMVSYLSPQLISEMAPSHLRGRLVLLNGIMITIGQVAAFLVGFLLLPSESWRLMFSAGLVPILILFIGTLFLPPSPRWLLLKGKTKEAYAIFLKIRNPQDVATEIKSIEEHAELRPARWQTIFSKKLQPVLWIGLGLGMFQQFVGINAIMYFGPIMFAHIGSKSNSTSLLATLGLGTVNMVTTLLVYALIDRYGRRTLLLTGLSIAFVALLLIGMTLTKTLTVHFAILLYIEMLFFIIGYCLSLGTLFWLIIAEIYPLNIRSCAMSFVTAGQWFACFLVTTSFLPLLNFIGASYVFYLFAFMCFLSIIFSYSLVPETKGVSLEQIEANLRDGKRSRDLGDLTLDLKT